MVHLLCLKNKKREINCYLSLINYFKCQQIYYQIYSTKRNPFDKLYHGNLFHFTTHYDSKLYANSYRRDNLNRGCNACFVARGTLSVTLISESAGKFSHACHV